MLIGKIEETGGFLPFSLLMLIGKIEETGGFLPFSLRLIGKHFKIWHFCPP
jgi:hypothetical protein